jgi:uncharacterized membrane protein (UPF0127 family)
MKLAIASIQNITWFKILAILLGVFILICIGSAYSASRQVVASKSTTLNGQPIRLLVTTTATEQYQGLSDRERICDSCGMLFTFDDARERTFVMRRMLFALDIVWVHKQRVVRVDTNLAPESTEPYTPYSSRVPVDTVLELPAGSAQRYGLTEGTAFDLKN